MDSLAGLEPQLAIPVILVVGAVLVYIFGFKQTQEPSYEHLAVLQSSSSYKDKHHRSGASNNPKQQSNKNSSSTAATSSAKPKSNGHLTANGTAKKAAPIASTSSAVTKVEGTKNKENKPPVVTKAQGKNAKDPANKPEDFESGEWIPAVTRKDKTKKPKEAPYSPGKKAPTGKGMNSTTESFPIISTGTGSPVKAPKIEDLLAEMNVLKEIEKQNHSTQTTPDKKKVAVEETVKKAQPQVEKIKAKVISVPSEEVEVATPAIVEAATVAPAQAKKVAADKPKSNVAFDEMGGGDSWEEAKSRGAKKRRTRKD